MKTITYELEEKINQWYPSYEEKIPIVLEDKINEIIDKLNNIITTVNLLKKNSIEWLLFLNRDVDVKLLAVDAEIFKKELEKNISKVI